MSNYLVSMMKEEGYGYISVYLTDNMDKAREIKLEVKRYYPTANVIISLIVEEDLENHNERDYREYLKNCIEDEEFDIKTLEDFDDWVETERTLEYDKEGFLK